MEELYNSIIMHQEENKQTYSPFKKDKIFNVRKLPYKQFDNQKYLKYNLSPLLKKQPFAESTANLNKIKNLEYQFQLAIMATPEYKEMQAKLIEIKKQQRQEKQEKINLIKEKEFELRKYQTQKKRLAGERKILTLKRNQLKRYLQQLELGQEMSYQEGEDERLMNMQYLRNMMMGMHYQGGWDIDIDNMTYEQLLELEEKMGKVSKGLTEEQYQQLTVAQTTKEQEQQLCSICYYNLKETQNIHILPCKHIFHCECIQEWFKNEKVCPMCKQQLNFNKT